MSPLMMRFFTLVGSALAAASMQSKARADDGSLADTAPVVATSQTAFDGDRHPL
jgi:hypothetical protein